MSDKVREPKSDFVNVNGVNLHYLDWGGSGEAILFIGGIGVNAHAFYSLASYFVMDFRVIAFSRRCHGLSDVVDHGFDLETRVDDIAKFLNYLDIKKATLVGHSMAGQEITHFASIYPDKTKKLIYLDAVFDNTLRAEILSKDPLQDHFESNPPIQEWDSVDSYFRYCKQVCPYMTNRWDVWEKSLLTNVDILEEGNVIEKFRLEHFNKMIEAYLESNPDYTRIQCPVLCFVAIEFEHPDIKNSMDKELVKKSNEYWNTTNNKWKLDSAEQLVENAGNVNLIKFEDAHHYFFIDQEEKTAQIMREFLIS
jgi:pimeloyl-ACP methyl ester carboxylesterase